MQPARQRRDLSNPMPAQSKPEQPIKTSISKWNLLFHVVSWRMEALSFRIGGFPFLSCGCCDGALVGCLGGCSVQRLDSSGCLLVERRCWALACTASDVSIEVAFLLLAVSPSPLPTQHVHQTVCLLFNQNAWHLNRFHKNQ